MLLDLLQERRSVRQFADRSVPPEVMTTEKPGGSCVQRKAPGLKDRKTGRPYPEIIAAGGKVIAGQRRTLLLKQ
jgi:hypothetical protein